MGMGRLGEWSRNAHIEKKVICIVFFLIFRNWFCFSQILVANWLVWRPASEWYVWRTAIDGKYKKFERIQWVLYTFYYIHIFPIWRISWLSSLFSHDWGAKLSIAKGILSSQRLQIVSSLLIILSPFLFILQPFLLPPSVCFGSPFNHVGTLMAAKTQFNI